MNDRIRALWARTRVHVWPERYVLASLPPERQGAAAALVARAGSSYAALVRERDEVSVTVAESLRGEVETLAARIAGPYRVLTLDAPLDLDVVGFLAPAAERLAAAGVSIVPQCGFRTDHLLVWDRDQPAATEALAGLIREAQGC